MAKTKLNITQDDKEAELLRKKKMMPNLVAKHFGNQSKACDEAGLGRSTHYKWYKNDADYAIAIDEAALALVDASITIVAEAILSGDRNLAWKVLSSPIAQSRGFYIPYGKEDVKKDSITGTLIINAN